MTITTKIQSGSKVFYYTLKSYSMLSLVHTSCRSQQLLQRARFLQIIGFFFQFFLHQLLVAANFQLLWTSLYAYFKSETRQGSWNRSNSGRPKIKILNIAFLQATDLPLNQILRPCKDLVTFWTDALFDPLNLICSVVKFFKFSLKHNFGSKIDSISWKMNSKLLNAMDGA